MQNDSLYSRNRHSCFNLQYHLILVTKYRKPAISDEVFQTIQDSIIKILDINKCELIVLNHDHDHIHLLFNAPPQIQLSSMINGIKTVTSRIVRRDHSQWLAQFYWKPVFWSRSYFICSVGDVTTAIVEAYIENQRFGEREN